MRSWYLYEQFKSLERSQLDAAQKLKDRSYQERILRQELSERRARRKLYDQFGLCQSESRLKGDKCGSNYGQQTTVSTSDDDFFESFYLLHEDERVTQVTGANEFAGDGEGDTFSQDGLSASQCCLTNYVTVDDQNKEDNGSYVESVTSVVENLKHDEFIPSKEIEFVQNSIDEEIRSTHADLENSIAEDINMQLDCVQEDIMSLENIVKLEDVDKISEDESFAKTAVRGLKNDNVSKKGDQESNAIAIWSRVVSFAYQLVQLNHGDCFEHFANICGFHQLTVECM